MPNYGDVPVGGNNAQTQVSESDAPWVRIMQDAFKKSTSYYENNYRLILQHSCLLLHVLYGSAVWQHPICGHLNLLRAKAPVLE